MKLSIVIPARNEAQSIGVLLAALQPYRARGHQLIVVDGGSEDDTVNIARPLCDQCFVSKPGRAQQMQTGAAHSNGDVLWFLHADSAIPPHSDCLIERALRHGSWGGFSVRLSGRKLLLKVVAVMMNYRSRLTGILTGDQGIFITRKLFDRVGGYHDLALMEDIDLCTRLKRIMPPAFADAVLGTSSRRWEQRGIVRTILLMWMLRIAFYTGVPPRLLAPYYV